LLLRKLLFLSIFSFSILPLLADEVPLSADKVPDLGDEMPHTRSVFVAGHGTFSSVFAKSGSFPVGIQANATAGASVGFGGQRFTLSALFDYHESVYSRERLNVLYRSYSGFALGLDGRIVLKTLRPSRVFLPSLGCGLALSGHFDKYDIFDQYMVYPVASLQPFALFSFNRFRLLSFAVSLPVSFALRASGNYVSVGLSVSPIFRFPAFL
jgi:hypothetical protein